MSQKAYFRKRTVIATICVVALIIVASAVKVNFKNLQSSHCVKAIDDRSIFKNLGCEHDVDIEEWRKYLRVYDLTLENKGNYTCATMTVIPPTKVCLYDLKTDIYISTFILHKGAWEREILSEFKDELLKDEKLGVLDIGANIGVYALYAATMGRKVVAVEPFMENVLRIHKAAILGGVGQNIVLVQNAVADKRDEFMLKLNSSNQGLTHVIKKKTCNKNCPPVIKTILLSDLRYISPFDRAIMKIDIQGHEPKAFTTIDQLIEQISVPVIFMEWEFFHPGFKAQLDHKSVQNMIQVLTKRGYLPYRLRKNDGKLLDINQHTSWPVDIVWHRNTSKIHSI